MSAPTVVIPDGTKPRRTLGERLRREARDLALVLVAIAVGGPAITLLRQVAPVTIWWPALTGGIALTAMACRTPDDSTTVRTMLRHTVAHPMQAITVAAIICLPWLGGWVLDAIRAGTEAAVRSMLGAAPSPSSAVSGISSWINAHLGGHR